MYDYFFVCIILFYPILRFYTRACTNTHEHEHAHTACFPEQIVEKNGDGREKKSWVGSHSESKREYVKSLNVKKLPLCWTLKVELLQTSLPAWAWVWVGVWVSVRAWKSVGIIFYFICVAVFCVLCFCSFRCTVLWVAGAAVAVVVLFVREFSTMMLMWMCARVPYTSFTMRTSKEAEKKNNYKINCLVWKCFTRINIAV